jgi:hypothetical protein
MQAISKASMTGSVRRWSAIDQLTHLRLVATMVPVGVEPLQAAGVPLPLDEVLLLVKSRVGSEAAQVIGARAEVGRPGLIRMTSVTSSS